MYLEYNGNINGDLYGSCDAEWGTDLETGKSTGGAIEWRSNKIQTVAGSTTEAEYYGASEAAKTGVYLRQLLADMPGFVISGSTLIKSDSTGSISNIKDNVNSRKMRHVLIYHLVR